VKRHPAIQPLSRQHHVLLLAVLLLKKGITKKASLSVMVSFLNEVWYDVLQPHLQQEEDVLIPLFHQAELEEENRTILTEHKALERLHQMLNNAKATQDHLQEFVAMLEKHIRYEERHYFPKIESLANPTTFQQLADKIKEAPSSCLQFSPRFWE
jgi:iron-sulfur cluster repair protein YtfE (RIC family)